MTFYQYPDYMYHHGVKGMKWGVRRKSVNQANSNYSFKQRKQDERLYGTKASKRVNKRLNKGESLISARHVEVKRRDRKEARKRTTKKVMKTATSIIGTAASLYLTDQFFYGGAGTKAVKQGAKFVNNAAKLGVINLYNNYQKSQIGKQTFEVL